MGYKKRFKLKNHPANFKRSKKHFQREGNLSLLNYFLNKMRAIKTLMMMVSMPQILSIPTSHTETINRTKILTKLVTILMNDQIMREMRMMKSKI